MSYIDRDYVPTIWENEVTLIDGDRMNKIESEIVNHENAESLRKGTLRTKVLPHASTNSGDVFTLDAIGAIQLSNSYEQVSAMNNKPYAATPYAVNQAYLNSAAIDTALPALRIAKESVLAQSLKTGVKIQFSGDFISGGPLTLQNSGTTLDFKLVIKDDSHRHSIATIDAPATALTKGIVQLSYSFDSIATDKHSDIVPTSKLFKDTISSTNAALLTERTRINTLEGALGDVKNLDKSIATSKLNIAIEKGVSAKSWVDEFTKDGGELPIMISNITENGRIASSALAGISDLSLRLDGYSTKENVSSEIEKSSAITLAKAKLEDAVVKTELVAMIGELNKRITVLEGIINSGWQ